jgi:hypothetical protein
MTDPGDNPPAAPEGEAQFDTGCAGCLAVVLAISAGVFALAAVDSALFADIADTPGRRNWLGALAPFQWGGVNIGALLLAAYLVFETVRLVRKLVDPRAAWIDGEVIRFHPALRMRPLPLAALERVQHEAGEMQSTLWLEHKGGRRIKVPMVDAEAADAFAAAAERARAERTLG